MRGKVIHYNGNDGKGLIAAEGQQHPFEISQWHSDTAPAVNQTVELELEHGQLSRLTRVAEETLLKEKAGELAGRLGVAGNSALQSLRQGAAETGAGEAAGSGLRLLGKPLLAAHAVFAVSALFLPYLKVQNPVLPVSQGYSLVGLSKLSEQLGSSIGGSLLPWLAILSILVPVFWRSRWAWLALLLPTVAVFKPWLALALALGRIGDQVGKLDAGMARMMTRQLLEMLGTGIGFWLCLLSSLFIAAIALKRTLLPPRAPGSAAGA